MRRLVTLIPSAIYNKLEAERQAAATEATPNPSIAAIVRMLLARPAFPDARAARRKAV